MTLISNESTAARSPLPVDTYTGGQWGELKYDQYGIDVVFTDYTDPRTVAAHEMEVANMVTLGDPAEEVREEFLPYAKQSIFLLAFKQGEPQTDDNLVGMMRLIKFDEVTRNKTLNDIAIIKAQDTNRDPERLAREFENRFLAETGCSGLEKVLDIATLATKLDMDEDVSRYDVADSMISATAQFLMEEEVNGNLEWVTAFNEVSSHLYFMRRLGYPFQKLFDFKPVTYTTFSDQGMRAQPAHISIANIEKAIKLGKTEHLAKFVTKQIARVA